MTLLPATVIAETPLALSEIWGALQMPDKAWPFRHDALSRVHPLTSWQPLRRLPGETIGALPRLNGRVKPGHDIAREDWVAA